MKPLKIKVFENKILHLTWEDNRESNIDLMTLRQHCPCANCQQDQLEWSSTYIPLYTSDQLSIEEINPVGSYGLAIIWKDGHRTGIYEFDLLHRLQAVE